MKTDDKGNGSEMDLNKTDAKRKGCDARPVYRKIFRHRNSLLTDLAKINHFESIYNMYLFFFSALVVSTVVYYIMAPDVFHSDMEMLAWFLDKKCLLALFRLLVAMNFYACISVYGIKCWVQLRNYFNRKGVDVVFMILYVNYQLMLLIGPAYLMGVTETSPFVKLIGCAEQARIMMKTHSFIVENVAITSQDCDKKDKMPFLSLKPFIYFMFAPTMIYRSHYPRTNEIRWSVAFFYLVKFVCMLFLFYTMVMRFYIPAFKNTGLVPFSKPEAVILFFKCLVFGFCFRWCLFYTSLHFWQNMFAELLRFGDREFYQDWWNSVSLAESIRKWNILVSEWLYTYVYLSLRKLGCNRQLARIAVYFLSTVGHEYCYAMLLGFELPHLFVFQFITGVGTSLMKLNPTSPLRNLVTNGMLLLGNAVIQPPFYMEWYARVNCPATLDKTLDFFVPRILSSNCQLIATS